MKQLTNEACIAVGIANIDTDNKRLLNFCQTICRQYTITLNRRTKAFVYNNHTHKSASHVSQMATPRAYGDAMTQ